MARYVTLPREGNEIALNPDHVAEVTGAKRRDYH
jgi:hypothetical protein